MSIYLHEATEALQPKAALTANGMDVSVAACTSKPVLTLLSENNKLKTEMYELMSERIAISFYDAAAIKSDYHFHEYFKGYVQYMTSHLHTCIQSAVAMYRSMGSKSQKND